MRLERSATPWLVASLIFGGATLLLAIASGDDPISAGLIELALWGSAIVTVLCAVGFLVATFPREEHKPVEERE